MYSMKDYRAALAERDRQELMSEEWGRSQKKVADIVAEMMAAGDRQMAHEVADEVYSLNDCGAGLMDDAVQNDLWLLVSNGFAAEAMTLRQLDWD